MKHISNSFQFQKITILSHIEKSGLVLKIFPKTLITTENNTIGKSTLLNCLFWGMGCEVKFENDWEQLEISTLVEFSVGNNFFKVKRDKHRIYLFDAKKRQWNQYEKITGEYLKQLNKILNFNILLKNSNSNNLSEVPPAFYFSPTYIEQMSGWVDLWSSFKNLGQFNKNNKKELSKYLCSLQNYEFYENKIRTNEFKNSNLYIEKEITNYKNILSYFDKFSTINPVHDTELFSTRYIDIENNINANKKEYAYLLSRVSSIDNEINIINSSINELEQDYDFCIENLPSVIINCPTCGVEHQNDLVNRFDIISDIESLKNEIQILSTEKEQKSLKLKEISKSINNNYILLQSLFENTSQDYSNYLIRSHITPQMNSEITKSKNQIKENQSYIREINKKNRVIEAENLKKVEKNLITYFNVICKDLEVKNYNVESLDDILDFQSGGANQIKLMLAKRLTFLKAIHAHSELCTPPLVVDSLRQQDLANNNYEVMLNTLIKETPDDVQLIVAAVKNEFTDAVKNEFEEIHLKDKLLHKKDYHLAELIMKDIIVNIKS